VASPLKIHHGFANFAIVFQLGDFIDPHCWHLSSLYWFEAQH